jgi:serine/threonine-protein kinase
VAFAPGTRLGPYEIIALIGAGGMGEVYRARDSKLNRDVALKVLPEAFAADHDRLARFKREAQVLASLNYPHIAAIYGFEDSGNTRALVLELVEGPTLADRIARGPLPIDETLSIAKQIAEALEAAHEQGIIHRDLKPANIKVREDGTVKVLDFGLAKAMEPASAISPLLTNSPTITTPAMVTGIGTLLGTAAYMSPEQAKGRPADKRSDVWAFGCALYEMLTGKRAFEGEDVSDTLAAVLRGEPDWTALPGLTPSSIALVARECLQKNRTERIADLSAVLFVLRQPALTQQPVAERRFLRWSHTWVGAACLAISALVTAGVSRMLSPSTRSGAVTRLTVPLGRGDSFSAIGRSIVALSPDATHLVYVANNQLYVRALNQLDAVPIRLTGGETNTFGRNPFFSRDGKWVGFWQSQKLKKVLLDGGTPMDICNAELPLGATWSDDNTILYSAGAAGIFRVSANGGHPELIVRSPEGTTYGPQLLPDGHSVLFTLRRDINTWDDADVVVESLLDHHRDVVIRGGTDARYVDTGHLVYVSNGTLFGQRFNLGSLRVEGAPVALVQDIAQSPIQTGAAHFSIARSGTLAYIPGSFQTAVTTSTLVLENRHGQETALETPPRRYLYPRMSPDGSRIAVAIRADDGSSEDIWIWDITRKTLTKLTTGTGRHVYPTWSPDGHRIAFATALGGQPTAWWQAADGSAPAEQLGKDGAVPTSFAPNGMKLVMNRPNGGGELGVITLAANRTVDYVTTGTSDRNGEVSPLDGRWLAYESVEAGIYQVFVRPFETKQARRWQVSTVGGRNPLWGRNGRELFYVDPAGSIMRVAVTAASEWTGSVPTKVLGGQYSLSLPGVNGRLYDVSLDGEQFLMLKPVATTQEQRAPDHIVIVQNWIEELTQRVPSK